MPLLRHTVTGDLYPYNESLARHPEMETVEDAPVAVDVVKEVKATKKATKKAADKPADSEPEVPVVDEDVDLGDLGELDI